MLYIGSGTKKGSEVVACVLGIPPEKSLYQGGGAETSELRFAAMSCFTQACPKIAAEATAFVRNCEAGEPPTPECVAAIGALNAAECD
jgi:hypothetical protein